MMSFVLALLSFLTTLPAHFVGGTSLSRPFWVLSFLDLGKVAEVQVTVSESENPPGSGPGQQLAPGLVHGGHSACVNRTENITEQAKGGSLSGRHSGWTGEGYVPRAHSKSIK